MAGKKLLARNMGISNLLPQFSHQFQLDILVTCAIL